MKDTSYIRYATKLSKRGLDRVGSSGDYRYDCERIDSPAPIKPSQHKTHRKGKIK